MVQYFLLNRATTTKCAHAEHHIYQLCGHGFLPARRYASAGLCDSNVSLRLSVCPFVRHVPLLCQNEESWRHDFFTSGSHTILVF